MLWGLSIRRKESRTREEYGARKVLGPESFLEEKVLGCGAAHVACQSIDQH